MLLRQFRQSSRKLWPVVRSTPVEAVEAAAEYILREGYSPEIILYDVPGTVGTEGVLSLLSLMNYLFIPLKADKLVVESSLHFARNLRQSIGRAGVRLREVYLFWTMVDKRERTNLFSRYNELIERLELKILHSQIAYRAKVNRELLPDGTGIGRSTILAAERSFARDAGIETFLKPQDISNRSALYVSGETKRKVLEVVRMIGSVAANLRCSKFGAIRPTCPL